MLDSAQIPSPERAGHCPACDYLQVPYALKNVKPYIEHASDIYECVNCGFIAHIDVWYQWDYACHFSGLFD